MEENKDYELVPIDWDSGVEGWDIRILTGEFIETVIRYGKVTLDGKCEEMKFNFAIISSPDCELTEENANLQECAGSILNSIIVDQIKMGTFKRREVTN